MTMICDSLIGTMDDIDSMDDDLEYTKTVNTLWIVANYVHSFGLITDDEYKNLRGMIRKMTTDGRYTQQY